MVDFLSRHSDLLKGKHSAAFTQNVAAKQWQESTDLLNSIPGPIKDWKSMYSQIKNYLKIYFYDR